MESTNKLIRRIAEHEAGIQALEQRCEALELTLAWLLMQQSDDRGYHFLCSQANEFDTPEDRDRYLEVIAALDHLRGLISSRRASRAKD